MSNPQKSEEYKLGSGTICLAGNNKNVIADSLLIRGLWDAEGELSGIQLELSCAEDQLRILKELEILPESTSVERGPELVAFFEMESQWLTEQVLSELGDDTSLSKLFLAEDRFPPILNLLHYRLSKIH